MNKPLPAGRWERRLHRPEVPRRQVYAAVGAALGLGAPVGLLILRMAIEDGNGWAWVRREVAAQWPVYLYLTLSTLLVFGTFGGVVGALHDEARRMALADALTGLPNRRQLHRRLDRAIAEARGDGVPLSLLLMDVDDLKHINDGGGHAAGDRALQAVADALRGVCLRSDVPARISGDEFAILAVGRDAPEALALAQRVRVVLARDPAAPRVSIGVATFARLGQPDAAALLAAADAALYVAKATGRDRVVEAGPADRPDR